MKVTSSVISGLDDVITALSGSDSSENRTFTVRNGGIDVAQLRRDLGMIQTDFAVSFGFSVKTLQNWEQGVREPEGPARAYLQVIRHRPEMVLEALREAADCREAMN